MLTMDSVRANKTVVTLLKRRACSQLRHEAMELSIVTAVRLGLPMGFSDSLGPSEAQRSR